MTPTKKTQGKNPAFDKKQIIISAAQLSSKEVLAVPPIL